MFEVVEDWWCGMLMKSVNGEVKLRGWFEGMDLLWLIGWCVVASCVGVVVALVWMVCVAVSKVVRSFGGA